MSAQAIITLIKGLGEVDRQAVFAAFAIDAPAAASAPKKAKEPKAPKEPKEPKAEKKPRANAGKPILHGSWTKHVMKLHGPGKEANHPKTGSADYQAFLAARIASARAGELLYKDATQARVKKGEKKIGDAMDEKEAAVGAHTPFVGFWKTQNPAAFEEFKAAWEAANPKGGNAVSSSDDAVTVVDDDNDTAVSNAVPNAMSGTVGGSGSAPAPAATSTDAAAKAKRGRKKKADMTPEELAAAKAKRAAKKAAKDSASNSAEGSRASSPPKVKDD
jgi:hypothetical protein